MVRVLAWLVVMLCGVVRAEGRVGLVNLRFVDVTDAEAREWRDAMQRSVEARGLAVIADADLLYVQLTSHDLFDCFVEDRCRTEIGRRLKADLLLTGQVSRDKDELLANLSMHAVDLQTTVKNQVVHCPGCTAATFRERLVETVNDLVTADRNVARATLHVRTQPPGAALLVDGRPVGTAELEVTVVAGSHRLEAVHENHDPLEIAVNVKAQERLEVDLKLPPRTLHAAVVPPPPPKASWWNARRIAGVTMMAAGGAGVISGIPLLAIDESYGTRGGGGALVGIGGALLVVGGVVLLMSGAQPVRSTLAPVVGPGAVGVVGQMQF